MINATGVGMHKTVGISPVPQDIINCCTVAIDLIYVPVQSEFLRIAESLGKKTINGMAMLFYQAYYAECIYFDVTPTQEQAKSLFEKYLAKKI
jgi:shikimate dehydrogenase